MIRVLFLFSLLLTLTQPSLAIREGTATAEVFIKHYAQSGDFGRLALWHKTAAECLARISVPMNEIAHGYYRRHGYEKWVARAEKEAQKIQKQHQYHCARAEAAWQKFGGGAFLLRGFPDQRRGWVSQPVLKAEQEKIEKFMAIWLPRYPNRFYEFGIYPTFFRKQRELAAQEGDYAKALHLEADAAEMCAAQYERIPVAYGLKHCERFRDAYLQYASYLRKLAGQNPKTLPPEIDKGKGILNSLEARSVGSQKTADAILQIARSDTRVKTALAGQRAVHAYPTFQGFAWIVSFSNQSRGNLVTVIINEKTMEVLDVF